MTVCYGTNVKSQQEELLPVSLSYIVELISTAGSSLHRQTDTLRRVRKYSSERYRTMKVALPYCTCSHFSPATRRLDHLDHAMGMILDIDWPSQLDDAVYERIKADPRVVLAYVSPSGHGAKVMFALETPITDAALYTRFYRWFSHAFAGSYHLLEVLDFKNCDATRVSFLCHDPDVYVNYDPLLLDVEMMPSMHRSITTADNPKTHDTSIAPDVYRDILHKLGSKPKLRKRAEPSVSAYVERVMPQLEQALAEYGIRIAQLEGLQYGAKVTVLLGGDTAEVNIYHGKKGYTVVSTAKSGTHARLAETTKHIIEAALPLRPK